MSSHALESRLTFAGFDPAQRKHLADAAPEIAELLPSILATFYERVEETPETRAMFTGGKAHMSQANSAQQAHWRRLATGRFDEEYFASVRQIGATHARIGLEPRWYIGAYALVLDGLIRGLAVKAPPARRFGRHAQPEFRLETILAVVKAALIDMELSVSQYFEQSQAARDEAMASQQEMSGLLAVVSQTAESVLNGAREIAQASEDLARRTESNAASLEQTSAAVMQIDARLKETATSANQTAQRADEAIGTVSTGRTVAEQAVQAMGRVSDSAKGIDGVIEGLDKIAFQTRVLAMNAAVEAGRAGEAGRGFAVVADLVSALAMRAEEEAKRARDQLTLTQTDVVTAVEAVSKVDRALEDITGHVGDVHKLLGAIARDNQAQSGAITEVTLAISEMDRSTQQNAAMVEETSAAARNLVASAMSLSEEAARSASPAADGKAATEAALRAAVPNAWSRAA